MKIFYKSVLIKIALAVFTGIICCQFNSYGQSNHAAAPGMVAGKRNFTSFEKPVQKKDAEVIANNMGYENDPELGMADPNVHDQSYYEILSKRTETTKTFAKRGTNGQDIIIASSTQPLHYRDAQGNWRTVSSQLLPDGNKGIYKADRQETQVEINTTEGYVSIGTPGKTMQYNRNLELVYVKADGTEQSLGIASWKNYTAGSEGVYVKDAWPGVDIEMYTSRDAVKTSFYINRPMPQYAQGRLVLRDHMKMDNGLSLSTQGEKEHAGYIAVRSNVPGEKTFNISEVVAYEKGDAKGTLQMLNYKFEDNHTLGILIPGGILNKPAASYPFVIDPLVVDSNAALTIPGSTYSALWTVGCATVCQAPVPPKVTVTDIQWSFNYITVGNAVLENGAVDFYLGTCRSPGPGPLGGLTTLYWYCQSPFGGTCYGTDISIFAQLSSCVPPPQCATYNLAVTMDFYQNYANAATCSGTYIAAASPLEILVYGHTVETQSSGTATGSGTVCPGATGTVTATGHYGVPPYTYYWMPGGGTGSPYTVNPTATTTYTVSIVDQCNDTSTGTATIHVYPNTNPGFTITPNPVCNGGTVNVAGLGNGAAANYNWLAPGSANPTVTATKTWSTTYATSGTYNIILNYSSNGCVFPDTQQVVISPPVAANPTSNSPICLNGILSLQVPSGGAGATYSWTGPGGFTSTLQNPQISPVTNALGGTYSVTITLPSGCSANGSTVVVVSPPVVATPTSNGPLCSYTTLQLNVPSGGPGTNYSWTGPAGFTSNQQNPQIPNVTTAAAGTYTVTVTLSTGCTATGTVNVVIQPGTPPPIVYDITYCQYDKAAPLNAIGSNMEWYTTATGGIGDTVVPVPSTQAPGTYTWYVTQTAPNGCVSDRAPIMVTVNFKAKFHIVADSFVCLGDSALFSYNGTTPPAGSLYYTWSSPRTTTILSVATTNTIKVKFDSIGAQEIMLAVADDAAGMCESIDSQSIYVAPPPMANFTMPADGCIGEPVYVVLANGTSDITYSGYVWNFNNANLASGTPPGPGPYTVNYSDTGKYYVSLTVTSRYGCAAFPVTDTINIHGTPTAFIDSISSLSVCTGDTISLQAGSYDPSNHYEWTPRNAFIVNGNTNRKDSAIIASTTTIQLTVTTPFGCKDSSSDVIQGQSCCGVYFPTAFTPCPCNNNGPYAPPVKDRIFHPLTIGHHTIEAFRIVNRWGQTVYSSANENAGWDGTLNGVPQEIGDYFWYIKYQCSNGNITEEKGTVTLIR